MANELVRIWVGIVAKSRKLKVNSSVDKAEEGKENYTVDIEGGEEVLSPLNKRLEQIRSNSQATNTSERANRTRIMQIKYAASQVPGQRRVRDSSIDIEEF